MTIRILAALALLSLMSSASAFRVLGQPERPYELALSQITLPKDTAGTLTMRVCDLCGIGTYRFADGAKFVVDGREMRFADFVQVMTDLRGNSRANDRALASVYIDVATERVTRVTIFRPRTN